MAIIALLAHILVLGVLFECLISSGRSMASSSGKLSTLTNLTYIKDSLLWHTPELEHLFQEFGWFHDILFRQYPRTPMNAHSTFAFRIFEDLHGIIGIGMHGAHNLPGVISSDWYQT